MGTIYLRRYDKATNGTIYDVSFWYKIPILDDLSISFNSPVSPMPLPQEDDEKQILMKMEGNSADISISWLIKNETSNMGASNTPTWNYGSDIKTTWQQINFLQQKFIPTGINDSFEVCIDPYNTVLGLLSPTADFTFKKRGTITKLEFRISGGEPSTVRATASFMVGEVVSSYGLNVPSAPKNFAVSSTLANKIDATWTAPSTTGGGTVRYVVYYRKQGNTAWLDSETLNSNLTSTSVQINLGSGNSSSIYEVYVRAINNNGKGERSIINTVTIA